MNPHQLIETVDGLVACSAARGLAYIELLDSALSAQNLSASRARVCWRVGKFASYLLVDGATLSIRRVEYDIEREIKALGQNGLSRANWIAKTLLAAAPQMP